MTKVDQFESVFRAAAKPVYEYRALEISVALVVTDLTGEAAETFARQIREFLGVLGTDVDWQIVAGDRFPDVAALLALVEDTQPDLLCTYRHLHSTAWKWPYGLGTFVDVLTQVTPAPVLVVPHPVAGGAMPHALTDTDVVMAITDHLTGDDRLVNYGVCFSMTGGTLHLTHVEDEAAFERFLETISKIPELDTETTAEAVRAQLMKEPGDYVESCRNVLAAAGVSLDVRSTVTMGHRLREYKRLIEHHEVDLLIMNTNDEDQDAMHGLARPLAVELRDIPLLML